MRTVVVTGAAGSLGQRVTARLAGHPDVGRVVAVDRNAGDQEDVDYPDLVDTEVHYLDLVDTEVHRLDLADTTVGTLERLMAGADCVIHLAWQTADTLVDGESAAWSAAAEVNRRALVRVLDGAAGARVASVIHLSSATVYGAWPDNRIPLTEDAPLRPNPEFSYAVAKAEAERRVAEWADAHGDVAVAVLRPAVTLGTPERPLYRALAGTRSPGTNDEARPVQYLHVDDLAAAVVLAWEERLTGVYNVAPDRGIGEDVARALAGGVARVRLPGRVARAVTAWSWDLWRGGVPREARAYAIHPWVVAADKLKAAGWEPQYSSEEALVATDVRAHWDDLPPGRRQNATLLLIAGAGAATVAAAVGAGVGIRALRRR